MALTLHTIAVAPLIRGLKNALGILAKGEAHAQANNIDPQDYLTSRIHPDMATLAFQVYYLTDAARLLAPRVNPSAPTLALPMAFELKDAPSPSFAELAARIQSTIDYLEGLDPVLLNGRENEEVTLYLPGPEGSLLEIKMRALEVVMYHSHTNFWFHVTTLYDILRARGVGLKKLDFLNASGLIEAKVVPMPKQ